MVITSMIAPGDALRFPLDISALQEHCPDDLRVTLVSCGKDELCRTKPFPVDGVCGSLSYKIADTTDSITLKFAKILPGSQFQLTGLPTYYAKTDQVEDFVTWAERQPGIKQVRVINARRVQLYSDLWNGKAPKLSYGTIKHVNKTKPTLTVIKSPVALLTRPVTISGEIKPGNVFALGGQSYTALKNDTPDSVFTALGIRGGLLVYPLGSPSVLGVAAGKQAILNTKTPTFSLQLVSDDATYNYFVFSVTSAIQPGNQFSIFDGAVTRQYSVKPGDSPQTVAAFFNSFNGYFRALKQIGSVSTPLNPQSFAGQFEFENAEKPVIELGEVSTPIDVYDVEIGNIMPGSIVSLNGFSYTVQPGDTIEMAKAAIGLTDSIINGNNTRHAVPIGTPVDFRVEEGANLLNYPQTKVGLFDYFISSKASEVIVELTVPESLVTNCYRIAILPCSCLLDPDGSLSDSSVLWASEPMEFFSPLTYDQSVLIGYRLDRENYQERLPISLNQWRIDAEDDLKRDPATGEMLRSNAIQQTVHIGVTPYLPESEVRRIGVLLRNDYLTINGTAYTAQKIDYSEVFNERRQLRVEFAQLGVDRWQKGSC